MTADDEHRELVLVWSDLRDALVMLPDCLRWYDIQHVEVDEKAGRVRTLASHLSGVVELASNQRYESALSLTRTALEQVVIDWLVFKGETYVQRYREVSEATWEKWQTDRAKVT